MTTCYDDYYLCSCYGYVKGLVEPFAIKSDEIIMIVCTKIDMPWAGLSSSRTWWRLLSGD